MAGNVSLLKDPQAPIFSSPNAPVGGGVAMPSRMVAPAGGGGDNMDMLKMLEMIQRIKQMRGQQGGGGGGMGGMLKGGGGTGAAGTSAGLAARPSMFGGAAGT